MRVENILQTIGNTPHVRINRLYGAGANVWMWGKPALAKTAIADLFGLHPLAVEDAVLEYIELFCADTQPAELRALRELALVWMERMAEFRPHLTGAVWQGTATRLSDIRIQLFCDDPKSAEICLIDHNVDYEPQTVQGFRGEPVEALSLGSPCKALGEVIGVHLLIYDLDDLRGALVPDARGRAPRGSLAAVQALLKEAQA